ncbi:uncharacterized protein LOC106162567 [Lingula anatina]|uniref:Uncharacterized protein LOC106162567 n=1 Tax=Lingula anatina TaxID=7574 RepID=A0A1S3IBU9_LINAN|nr:uncharacterized protein LOC106162567 [Lingula anatina]|eukprot:XP_013395336.1 uncharacterized protein LOC106162567 [Lingula anatina]
MTSPTHSNGVADNQSSEITVHKELCPSDLEYSDKYKGYTSTKDGPKASDDTLDAVKSSILQCQPPFVEDYTFHGNPKDDNLFSRIIRGEVQQWRIWQSEDHVAVLTPFPNTPGFTVLLPRKRLSSNIPAIEEQDYVSLMLAARKVGQLLQKAFNTPNVAMVCEGMAVDYAHVKLIPLHASGPEEVARLHVEPEHVETYRGYITTKEGPQAKEEDLKSLQKLILKDEEDEK